MRLIFTFLLLFYLSNCFAQSNHFTVKGAQESDLILISDALNNAHLDMYRLKDERRILKFESGAVVELFSVRELKAANLWNKPFEGHQGVDIVYPALFNVSKDGVLIAKIELDPMLQEKNAQAKTKLKNQ